MEPSRRAVLGAALLACLALLGVAAIVPDGTRAVDPPASTTARSGPSATADPAAPATPPSPSPSTPPSPPSSTSSSPPPAPAAPTAGGSPYAAVLPHGETSIFGGDRFLVAYYGTAGTGSLGVLGETDPDTAFRRLSRAAAPFGRAHSPVQPVYELIVTVVDGRPGPDGDWSHDISRAAVQAYIDAAHRHGALLLLDLQPGRSDFPTVARRWGWALRDPYVGLALDPEWRMGRRQVPGRVIGSVGAAEVNRTSAWLHDLVVRHHLPQKLFVLHQFRGSMIRDLGAVRSRPGLAMVQHVDGYGTPAQKIGTFHAVARPGRFRLGFKLFYDEDRRRMSAADVRHLRPRVRFVSFQ